MEMNTTSFFFSTLPSSVLTTRLSEIIEFPETNFNICSSTSNFPNSSSNFSIPFTSGSLQFPVHWWKYRDDIENAPTWFYAFVGIYFAILGLIGTVGNLIVLWVFCSTPQLRTPSNVLVINLAACDLIFSLLIGFPMIVLASFNHQWLWGNFGCQFYAYVASLTGLASINCLAVISMDRYMVVGRPLMVLSQSNFRRSFTHLGLIWTWSIIWSTLPLLGWGEFVLEGFGLSCTFDYLTQTPQNIAYNICLFVFCFGIPVLLIFLSYFGIIFAIIKNRKEFTQMTSEATTRQKQELKITKIFGLCVLFFIICWLPYATVAQLGIYGVDIGPYSAQLPVMFAKTSAIWNPFIYAFSHPRYRKTIAKSSVGSLFTKTYKFSTDVSKKNTTLLPTGLVETKYELQNVSVIAK